MQTWTQFLFKKTNRVQICLIYSSNIADAKLCKSLQIKSPCVNATPNPERVVYVSNSINIFENLALEDWLYENADLTETDYLLMWRNTPSVVIGRHQNPWVECDIDACIKEGVDVARRNSGGGTVFHDEGN